MSRSVMRFLLFVLAVPSSLLAATLEGPLTNPANGHQYYLLKEASWTDSEKEAVSLGGHLVTINDEAEQQWVFGTFANVGGRQRSLWIGLNDANQEGAFVWSSGENPDYANWLSLQPDDSPVFGGEDFVHMMRAGNGFGHPAGKWNDMDNLDSFPELQSTAGVVEIVPEPASGLCLSMMIYLMSPVFRSCW